MRRYRSPLKKSKFLFVFDPRLPARTSKQPERKAWRRKRAPRREEQRWCETALCREPAFRAPAACATCAHVLPLRAVSAAPIEQPTSSRRQRVIPCVASPALFQPTVSPEDKQKALEAKNAGNDAFSAAKFQDAVTHFTAAIAADPTDHIFFSNRRHVAQILARRQALGFLTAPFLFSACYALLNQYSKAVEVRGVNAPASSLVEPLL